MVAKHDFKVGDRVRVRDSKGWYLGHTYPEGSTGTVKDVDRVRVDVGFNQDGLFVTMDENLTGECFGYNYRWEKLVPLETVDLNNYIHKDDVLREAEKLMKGHPEWSKTEYLAVLKRLGIEDRKPKDNFKEGVILTRKSSVISAFKFYTGRWLITSNAVQKVDVTFDEVLEHLSGWGGLGHRLDLTNANWKEYIRETQAFNQG